MPDSADKSVDWERIEADFRAGALSLREIAKAHPGTNHVAIARRAKKLGWTRSLRTKIHERAEQLVTRSVVTRDETANRAVSEIESVEANARALADLKISHRSTIKTGRSLVEKLMTECMTVRDNLGLFDQLRDALAEETEDPDQRKRRAAKLDEMLQRVLSLPGRVSAVKGLSEALRNLIGLEREAWGLTTAPLQAPLESLSDDDLKAELARLRAQAT